MGGREQAAAVPSAFRVVFTGTSLMLMPRSLTGLNPALAQAFRACRAHFIGAAAFSGFMNILSLAPTLYMLQVYSRVLPTGGVATLGYLTLILLFSLATMSLIENLRGRLLLRSGLRIDHILAQNVLTRIYRPLRTARPGSGSALLRDFDAFRQTLSGPGIIALFDLPWTVIFLALCFYLHPYLGFLTVGAGVLLALVAVLNERASYRYLTRSAESMSRAYEHQDAVGRQADVVRALGMARAMVAAQIGERHEAMREHVHANLNVGVFSSISRFLRLFMQSFALGVGVWLAVDQKISSGAVFAASLLMSRTLAPLEQLIGSWRGLTRGYNAFLVLNASLDAGDRQKQKVLLPAPTGQIDVEGLAIVLPGQNRYLIQNVTFSAAPGEMIGIAGASGAGKSRLARILAGCDPYDTGAVRFDRADLREWDSEQITRYVGYLPQNTALFEGTVRDNISRFEILDRVDAHTVDEEVIKAARLAGIHEMILELPNGYNTAVGAEGQGLSGGQAQRIAFARALYRDPKILILDEPNSFQDTASEKAMVKVLRNVCERGGVVIFVAHRTALLEAADKLLVLGAGRVQFFGDPRKEAAIQRQPQPVMRQLP